MSEKEVLTFIAEHYDPNPQVLIKFLLKYYPESHEVEMKEIITGRKFLSLTKVADCNRHDFVLGGAVVILSRDLKLIDYGDKKTRLALSPGSEIAAVFLPPSALEMAHEVIGNIEQSGLTLLNLKAFHVPEREIENVAKLLQVAPAILSGNSNYCIYMEFRGLNAIAASAAAIGCCDILVAASSSDQVEAFRNQFLFTVHMPIARYKSVPESSCCVIKPHIIKSRLVGNVLRGIKQEGVEITAMQIFHMDRIQAAEFYDVYSGMKDFHKMVDEVISGPVLAMEIHAPIKDFRKIVGPWDVDLAKSLHPNTIRAKFGRTAVQNVVHCTDLEEEGTNELSYFFDIMATENEFCNLPVL